MLERSNAMVNAIFGSFITIWSRFNQLVKHEGIQPTSAFGFNIPTCGYTYGTPLCTADGYLSFQNPDQLVWFTLMVSTLTYPVKVMKTCVNTTFKYHCHATGLLPKLLEPWLLIVTYWSDIILAPYLQWSSGKFHSIPVFSLILGSSLHEDTNYILDKTMILYLPNKHVNTVTDHCFGTRHTKCDV